MGGERGERLGRAPVLRKMLMYSRNLGVGLGGRVRG